MTDPHTGKNASRMHVSHSSASSHAFQRNLNFAGGVSIRFEPRRSIASICTHAPEREAEDG